MHAQENDYNIKPEINYSQIKRQRKSSTSTHPVSNIYESLMYVNSNDPVTQISKMLTSKMDIKSDLNGEHTLKKTKPLSYKRSSTDCLLLPQHHRIEHFSQEPIVNSEEYFLPPSMSKTRRCSVNVLLSDLKYQPDLALKMNTFKADRERSNEEVNKQPSKSKTKARTLSQVNTRHSISSCLSNFLSLNTKENNNHSTSGENSDSSLSYHKVLN